MIKNLQQLSQVLEAPRILISASQEEYILKAVKNLCSSLTFVEEPKFHDTHPQEEPKASTTTLTNLRRLKTYGPQLMESNH